jgi:serine/threonine protein kinase
MENESDHYTDGHSMQLPENLRVERMVYDLVERALDIAAEDRVAFLTEHCAQLRERGSTLTIDRHDSPDGDGGQVKIGWNPLAEALLLLRKYEEIDATNSEPDVETIASKSSVAPSGEETPCDEMLAATSAIDPVTIPQRTEGTPSNTPLVDEIRVQLNDQSLSLLAGAVEFDADFEPRLSNGSAFAHFKELRFIASGGMGEVYEAFDERLRRRVAVKVLPMTAAASRAQRFAREAVLMARVEHPAIARLYEWGSVSVGDTHSMPIHFIAMEFIEGVDLRQACVALRRGSGDDPTRLIEVMLPIVDAVAYAHARGVLHRDIKPANILVEPSGTARLLDFGVAALIEPDEHISMTVTGESMHPGTLAYMSPEQVRGGSARVTTASDVYALGLVLAEVLTGHAVITTTDRGLAEVVEQVLSAEPPAIAARKGQRASAMWRSLDFVVRKALHKDPSRRHASASALAEDLRRVLRSEAPDGRVLGKFESIRAFVSRHRRGIMISAISLGAVGVMASVAAMQVLRAREAEARTETMISELLEGSRPLVVDLHKRLLDEQQPLAARRAALEATVAYLEWVLTNSGDDARVLREVATRYRQLALVAGSGSSGSLGDTAAAVDYYLRCRAILDQLVERATVPSRFVRSGNGSLEESELRILRSSVLREYASLIPFEERAPYYELANADQRAAIALMPEGDERDKAERFMLTTMAQRARLAMDPTGFVEPIARFCEMLTEERFARDAEFLSEYALAQRYHADVLAGISRFDEALEAARASERSFHASIERGLDEFTNNRHLARVETMIVALNAVLAEDERDAEASLGLLKAALERSRMATNLKPRDSFARISFFEMLPIVADAAIDIARAHLNAGDAAGARQVAAGALQAVDDGEAWIRAFPIEGTPHPREPYFVEMLEKARETLRGF